MTTLALLALALLSQDPAAPLALERNGSGLPVCGLGREFHAGRRAALMEAIGDELLFFRGMPVTRGYTVFRQDKTFWWLTGIESPTASVMIDGASGREVLFLPKGNAFKERWEGELWDAGDDWLAELTGFDEVRTIDEVLPTLKDALGERTKIGISLYPEVTLAGCYDRALPHDRRQKKDALDGRESRARALADALEEELGVETFNVAKTLTRLRWVKTPEEIAAIKRASRSGALAMVEAMRSTRPGLGEWELDALMTFEQVRLGAAGPAYHAIVGSGPNSCVLHYSASSRRMSAGEVVLIDYGPEVDHFTTDITRTWPVDGTFTPRMAELYDAVLASQKAGIAAVKPGIGMQDVSEVCTDHLRDAGFGDLILHGACHWVGMEVHDPGPSGELLVPGVVFTIEPGLYDLDAGIGIRIEDVVVVTEDGCEVITLDVPRERAEITALIGETGVLDWLRERGN